METKVSFDKMLIAPCGINCGTCYAYLRVRNKCIGCRPQASDKPKTRLECRIKTCERLSDTKSGFCYECQIFPCDNIKHIDKRYREKYKTNLIQNLISVKSLGMEKYLIDEVARWTCINCGSVLSVHKEKCPECGFNRNSNLLPKDGTVNYYGKIFSREQADFFMECLLKSIKWKHDELVIMGRKITTLREVAWYGDSGLEYRYSGVTKTALSWTKELSELKALVENKTGEQFNSCLLNLYHNGDEGMGWHTDAEKELKKDGAIASLSFGAERKFSFKHKHTKEAVSVVLEHGSLLVMKGTTQTHWLHCLPKSKKITSPRVNITFRTIVIEA